MSNITVQGLGSGLDVANLVTQLVAAEGAPASQRLDLREAQAQARITAYGTLKGAFSALQTSLASLTDASTFLNKSATSSDTSIASITTTSSAAPGSFNLDVTQLATSNSLVTDAALTNAQFTSLNDVVGTGSITFNFGTTDYDPDTDTYTPPFVQNPDQGAKTVQITDGSLSGIRDAINEADIGVTASTIFDGSSYRLAFSADSTGADNSLEITVADDDGDNVDTAGLSLFAFNENANFMLQTQAAQSAQATVNGISISSSTNTLSNTLDGSTITLLDIGTSTVTVDKDAGVISGNIGNFVAKYNSLVSTVNDLTAFDPDSRAAGSLNGDSLLRNLDGQLDRILSNPVAGATSSISILADIGITRSPDDGSLVLDNSKLEEAIKNDPDAVTGLFAAFGQTSDTLVQYSSSTAATLPGAYNVDITQVAAKGSLDGSAAANLTITAGVNDSVSFSVDGVATTVTLSANTYTASALALELQFRLNDSQSLKDQSVAVTVTESAGVLSLVSNRFGSASKISITGGNGATDLLGASPTATDGLDVAGTIGGFQAIGSGQTLTGTNAAVGLALEIQGGALGNRGTINFTTGYASEIDDFLTGVLADDGILDSVSAGLENRVKGIGVQRDELARRMTTFEARLQAQFTAMDILVSQMQNTGNFLTSQLASLPVIGASRN